MKIIKAQGKLAIQFTSNGDFAEALKGIAKSKNIDFDALLNTFCSDMLSNIENGNIINY